MNNIDFSPWILGYLACLNAAWITSVVFSFTVKFKQVIISQQFSENWSNDTAGTFFFIFFIFNKKDEKSQFELTQMSFYREIHMISQSC